MDIAELGAKFDSSDLKRGRDELGRFQRSAKKTETATERLERQNQRLLSSFAGLRSAVAGVATALGSGLALRAVISDIAEFEQGLIGVGKTTGIAGADLQDLGDRVRDISSRVPVATTELLALGQSAGQLGVKGSDNIARFTETIGKLGIASNLAGEQAATAFARILTVTGTPISEVDRLGASIVQLGNNFAATESEISRAATRVAQSTSQFGVGADEVLGIGTALRSVGVEAEAGGTQIGLAFQAINDALRSGGEEMQRLQDLTGQTGESLRDDFFNGRSAEVFEQFIAGLGRIQQGGGDVSAALEDFELQGTRAVQVLGTLATRSGVLDRALEAAEEGYRQNTALNQEAATAAGTFSSQLQRLKNDLFNITSAGDVESLTESVKDFRDVLDDPSVIKGVNNLINGTIRLAHGAAWAASWYANLGQSIGEAAARAQDMSAFDAALSALPGGAGLPTLIEGLTRRQGFEIEDNLRNAVQPTMDFIDGLGQLGNAASNVQIPLRRTAEETANAGNNAATAAVQTGALSDNEKALRQELTLLNRQLDFMRGGMDASTASMQAQIEAAKGTERQLLLTEQAIGRVASRQEERARVSEEASQREQDLMQRNIEVITGLDAETLAYQRRLTDLRELQARNAIGQDTYNAAINRATRAFEEAQEEAGAMSQAAIQAGRNIQSAFADFLFDPFEDGLSGMLDSFTRTLQRMVAEAASAQILEGALGGTAVGGFFGIGSGLGSGVQAGRSVESAGAISGARANGGPVSAGTPYLVGERGRELFVPQQSGMVVPNHAIGGGGSSEIHAGDVIVNNYAGAEVKTRRERSPDGRALERTIIDITARNVAENGPLGRSIARTYGVSRTVENR